MRVVEGVARIGPSGDGTVETRRESTPDQQNAPRFPDVETFVDRVNAIRETTGATVQAFDARYVVGREHVERAVELADRAIDRGDAVADDPGVEVLLWAAGRRQIDRALGMGVSDGVTPVVGVVHGGDESAATDALRSLVEPSETLGTYDEARVREFFDVTDRELEATDAGLESLVLERVALLAVNQ